MTAVYYNVCRISNLCWAWNQYLSSSEVFTHWQLPIQAKSQYKDCWTPTLLYHSKDVFVI